MKNPRLMRGFFYLLRLSSAFNVAVAIFCCSLGRIEIVSFDCATYQNAPETAAEIPMVQATHNSIAVLLLNGFVFFENSAMLFL